MPTSGLAGMPAKRTSAIPARPRGDEEARGPHALPRDCPRAARASSEPERLLLRARQEVLHFDMPPYLSVDNTTQLDRLASGVVYRTVYGRQAVDYPGALVRIDECLAAGERARVTARLPMKMMIVDREQAVLSSFAPDQARPGATVIIDRGPLLDGLVELFERVWSDSVPLDTAAAPGAAPGELDAAEARLLTLLLSGLTDDAVARHLGIARRTVLRRARGLMDRAGVATRMQLGWYAARRGWIEVPH